MSQIQFSYLQVVPVQEPAMAGYCPIDGDLLLETPSPVVVGAGNHGSSVFLSEDHGAVVGVVAHLPDAR